MAEERITVRTAVPIDAPAWRVMFMAVLEHPGHALKC